MKFTGQEKQAESNWARGKNGVEKTNYNITVPKSLKEKQKNEEITLPAFKTYYAL